MRNTYTQTNACKVFIAIGYGICQRPVEAVFLGSCMYL